MVLMEKGSGWELFWLLMGRTSALLGMALLIPAAVALFWQEPEAWLFLMPASFALFLGVLMMWMGQEHMRQLTIREGALFMVLVWPFMGVIGLMPYIVPACCPTGFRHFSRVSLRLRRRGFRAYLLTARACRALCFYGIR